MLQNVSKTLIYVNVHVFSLHIPNVGEGTCTQCTRTCTCRCINDSLTFKGNPTCILACTCTMN